MFMYMYIFVHVHMYMYIHIVFSGTLSGQSNGDTYTCTAMNNVSSPETRIDYKFPIQLSVCIASHSFDIPSIMVVKP